MSRGCDHTLHLFSKGCGGLCSSSTNCKAGPRAVGFIWGLPGNYVSAYIYMSPDFENFSTLLLVGLSLSRIFFMCYRGRLVVPRLLWAPGSFGAIYYCRMYVSCCIMTQNATCSLDLEKGWAALSSLFCRISSTQTSAWGIDRSGLFGKAASLALTLVVSKSPRSIRCGAWSGAGVPLAVEGVPLPRTHLC